MENNFSLELTNEFLQVYKELEEIEKQNKDRFEKFKINHSGQLDGFRTLRNVLSHNQSNSTYPAIVSKAYLEDIKDVVRKLKTKAFDICTKREKLFIASEEDDLSSIIEIMHKNNYSYVPILNSNGIVEHIITEKSIITILANSKEGMIYDNTVLIKDYLNYFELTNNPNEHFIFVSRNDYASDIEISLGKMRDEKITSVAFVTENGKSSEKILGMINAWNLLNY